MSDLELRAPARPVSASKAPPWYESQWTFFWTIVGAILMAGLIAGVIGAIGAALIAEQARRDLERSVRQLTQSRPSTTAPAKASPRYRTMQVPPQTHEVCLQQSGGVLNEQYRRCRSGYTYQQRVD